MWRTYRKILYFVLAVLKIVSAAPALAGEVRVAVAANFTETAKAIGQSFEDETGHMVRFSFGSTGQLYAQITQGAPFEVFLAADQERPRLLVEQGEAFPGSQFTYAYGKLVLYSADADLVTGPETLSIGNFKRVAIANPATAPYGAAAIEVLQSLEVEEQVTSRIVRGQNISQTWQFVETGNAELGFVARSQLVRQDTGSYWHVPQALHSPISQDAVLLQSGVENEIAKSFLLFLASAEAKEVIARHGYGITGKDGE